MSARRASSPSGFTLLEIVVALGVVGIVTGFVFQIINNAVRGQDMVREGLRAPKIENAILGQIVRDLRYLYWDGFVGNTGFIGRNSQVGGKDADSLDFVTARPSRVARAEEGGARDELHSPVTEVGYALRQNPNDPDSLELWRREDWGVDDDPVQGGKYAIIYDKIKRFNLNFFPTPEDNFDDKAADSWDTRAKGGLPYAIVLEIKFVVDVPTAEGVEAEEHFISRIITLKGAYDVDRTAPGQPAQPPPGG
jgi:prepilin-type N-terminal cleavage/methylation domain-containing protein